MMTKRHLRRTLYAVRLRLRQLAHPPLRPFTAVISLVLGSLTVWWLTTPSLRPSASPPAVTVSTDRPSEDPIKSYHSTATGAQPKYLRLPSIGAEGFVQSVGVDQHRQVAVPTNINLAGWFNAMPIPGDPGLSIIDGHLDGRTQPGIFAHLASLKPGDEFSVELASGAVRHFQVKSVQSLTTSQAVDVLFSQIPGIARQLNLITCGGTYNRSSGYDHRVIVGASLIK